MEPSESFALKDDNSDEEKSIYEMQLIAKEEVNGIIENLNKRFEELMQKFDKTLAMNSSLQNINKSVIYSLEKKNEDTGLNIKHLFSTSLIQSFKSEILTTLVTQLEIDIKDVLIRLSYYFQDNLKLKLEKNNREEEKSKKLTSHMKNCVVGFISLEESISKTIRKKEKALSELDLRTSRANEIIEPIQSSQKEKFAALKLEIDDLLNNKKYEQAIIRVLSEEKVELVQGVLAVLNPKPLIGLKLINPNTAFQLFSLLLANIEKCINFQEIYVWLEELAKIINGNEIKTLLPKIFEASYTYQKLNTLAKICSKIIE